MNASLQCQTTRLVPGPSPWNVRIQDFMDENDPALDTRSYKKSGGARRDRTDDLMLAKHALSQLSYGPGELYLY